MECWVQEVYVIFPSLLFNRVKITFYCPNWYDKHSTNMSDLNKTQEHFSISRMDLLYCCINIWKSYFVSMSFSETYQ